MHTSAIATKNNFFIFNVILVNATNIHICYHLSLKALKSPTEAEQEIIGGSRVGDLQTCVDEQALIDKRLQRQNVIEATQLFSFVDDVMSDTKVD
jgi:hypothetical protein